MDTLNGIIRELQAQSGINPERLSHMTVAGNTVMTHLLLGLDPKFIRESPYTPVANFFPPSGPGNWALRWGARSALFPSLHCFLCGRRYRRRVLGSGIYKRKPLTLYIDIGTNGEIVVGNSEWLVTAACSAGPAFEGGGSSTDCGPAPGPSKTSTWIR